MSGVRGRSFDATETETGFDSTVTESEGAPLPAGGAPGRQRAILLLLALAVFMIMLDSVVVTVALPALQADLGVVLTDLEWITNAYLLALGVLLLTGGTLADRLGPRRVLGAGVALFAGASLLCGLAPALPALLAGRALQGAGAALLFPAALAVVAATFPPERRGAALGSLTGLSSLGIVAGPLVGGLLVQTVGWRWIFFINLPIGLLVLLGARRLLAAPRRPAGGGAGRPLDLPGLLTSGGALLALTYAVNESDRLGWGSPAVLGLLALAALLLAAFVGIERAAPAPMLDLALFRQRAFAGAVAVAFLAVAALTGVPFFLSLYLQQVRGFSPAGTGVAFLAFVLAFMVAAPLAGRLADRSGPRAPMVTGLLVMAVAFAGFTRLGPATAVPELVLWCALSGVAVGLALVPTTAAALWAVPVAEAGMASGVVATFRQLGGTLGLALMAAVVAARTAGAPPLTAPGGREAFLAGLSLAYGAAAAVALLGAAVAAVAVRRPAAPSPHPAPPPAAAPAADYAPRGGA